VLIFGESYLLKGIQKNTEKELSIWSLKPLTVIDEKDKKVYETLSKSIEGIVFNIKALQNSEAIIARITLTSKTIAEELKIPKKHIDFVFKYYCYYSINDYSNLIKILYAIKLINSGFLKEYTVEALGAKCLFNSRYTFSQNFKKFVGVSASDYSSSMHGEWVKNDLAAE
jgi:AraC-like DNA-binding protein